MKVTVLIRPSGSAMKQVRTFNNIHEIFINDESTNLFLEGSDKPRVIPTEDVMSVSEES